MVFVPFESPEHTDLIIFPTALHLYFIIIIKGDQVAIFIWVSGFNM